MTGRRDHLFECEIVLALVGAEGFLADGLLAEKILARCALGPGGLAQELPRPDSAELAEQDIALLDEIADTILPETSTSGAKAVATGAFMHGRGFLEAAPEERLDREQYEYTRARAAVRRGEPSAVSGVTRDSPPHYCRMMKELALLGYFTSEIGYHEAQRYVETPGRFDPCVPETPGERACAPHA